jgi:membrane protease YdiL (CAAX protease family)
MIEGTEAGVTRLSRAKYLVGLVVIYITVYSQYVLPDLGLVFGGVLGLVFDMMYVYGIPIVVIVLIWGRNILRKSLNKMYNALKYGFASYGGFTALGYGVSVVIILILIYFDPNIINILNQPNPVLNISPELAWLMVLFSFIVVGPAEEFLFRGFVYGGLLTMYDNQHWLSLAFLSSILFAAVHLYYVFVYGIASTIMFVQLIAFGMAMAVTYYLSDGNLLIPAFLHGLFDATGFLTIAVSLDFGGALRIDLLFLSLAILGLVLLQRLRNKEVSY